MTSLDMDLVPFGTSPTSPNALSLNVSRLATDTDESERQMSGQVEAALNEIASLLGTNRYYRRDSSSSGYRFDGAGTQEPRHSLHFTPDTESSRTWSLATGLPLPDNHSALRPTAPTRTVSFQPHGVDGSGDAITADHARALCLQLEQSRDLMRRLDSERRFYRQCALRQQRELDHASEEKLAMSMRASEGHRMSLDAETQLTHARALLREQETAMDRQAEELLALRRFLRSLPPAYAQAYDLQREEGETVAAPFADALHLVPDRRFEEAFKDKMSAIHYKRRCHRARIACEETSARYEALCMRCEDADAGSTRRLAAAAQQEHNALDALTEVGSANVSVPAPSSYTLSTAATLLLQRRRSSVLEFPVNVPFSPATPQDAELKSLIFRSAYAEPLMEARDGLLRLSTRLKMAEENGLQNLYNILCDVLRKLPAADRPLFQKQFEKQMDAVQRAQRELLFQLVAHVNTATADITTLEKKLQSNGADASGVARGGTRKARHDVACMATDTSMEDYRLHRLEAQARQKELRLLEERGETEKKLVGLQTELQQQQVQTLTILASLENLERSVAASTRLALRQQRVSGDVLEQMATDPFRAALGPQTLRTQDLSDARLVAKVAESVDTAVGCLRQLTHLAAPAPNTTGGEHEEETTQGRHTKSAAGKTKRKKLALPARRTSDSLGLPSPVSTRTRSRTADKNTRSGSRARRGTQDETLTTSLPDFTQSRRHTLPAVPTHTHSGQSSASSGARRGGGLMNVPTPPSTSLATKPDGQAPRRPSASTSLVMEASRDMSAEIAGLPATPHTALTPLSVNRAESRRSSGCSEAPSVAHTAKRGTAGQLNEGCAMNGGSPTAMPPVPVIAAEEPGARSTTREPGAMAHVTKSRENSLAPVSVVNIELFGGQTPPSKQ